LEMMDQARIHTMDDDFNGNCGNKCVKVWRKLRGFWRESLLDLKLWLWLPISVVIINLYHALIHLLITISKMKRN
jgi:hypothetical protein